MNKQDTQTEFEAITFMHARPQEKRIRYEWEDSYQEDYMDKYTEVPK